MQSQTKHCIAKSSGINKREQSTTEVTQSSFLELHPLSYFLKKHFVLKATSVFRQRST
jgi:hypothetical protein